MKIDCTKYEALFVISLIKSATQTLEWNVYQFEGIRFAILWMPIKIHNHKSSINNRVLEEIILFKETEHSLTKVCEYGVQYVANRKTSWHYL